MICYASVDHFCFFSLVFLHLFVVILISCCFRFFFCADPNLKGRDSFPGGFRGHDCHGGGGGGEHAGRSRGFG